MASICILCSCGVLPAKSATQINACTGSTTLTTQGRAFTLPSHTAPQITRAASGVPARSSSSQLPTSASTSRGWLHHGVVTTAAAGGTAGAQEGLSPEELKAVCPAVKEEISEEALQAVDLRVGVVVSAAD